MNRFQGAILLLTFLGGCANTSTGGTPQSAPPPTVVDDSSKIKKPLAAADMGSDVVARVNGKPITLAELQKPLIEAYGLKVLLFLAQLNLARQEAEQAHVTITDADYTAEQERTLKAAFEGLGADDYPQALTQLLARMGVSRVEFDMLMQTNAIIRKIAEPQVAAQMKEKIGDAQLLQAFNAMYGETAELRHIQCANPQEAMQVRTRLGAGEKFEALARTMSRNPRTAVLEGELKPFSRQMDAWDDGTKIPQGFKDFAFSAQPGDISDPIQAGDTYHILKLVRRNQPKVVKFENEKEHIRDSIKERAMAQAMTELRAKLAQLAGATMSIEEPTLKKQYDVRRAEQARAAEAQAQERARQDILNRAKPVTQPADHPLLTTRPTTTSTGAPQSGAASPANAPAGERPPAPKSAGQADNK